MLNLFKVLVLSLLTTSMTAHAGETLATDYRLNFEGRTIKDYAQERVKMNWPVTAVSFRFIGSQLTMLATSDSS